LFLVYRRAEIVRYVYVLQRFLVDGDWDRDDGRRAISNKEFVVLQTVAAIDSSMFDSDRKLGIYDNASRFFVIGGWLELEPELLRR